MHLVFLTDRLKKAFIAMNHQDVFSDVFSTLRLHSNLYFRAQFNGRFSVEVPREHRTVRFHLVLKGNCYLHVPGQEPVPISKGDLALIPNGGSQILSAAPYLTPLPLATILAAAPPENGMLDYGEGLPGVNLLCGYCSFDNAIDHPVLTALPALLLLRPQELQNTPSIVTVLNLLSQEAEQEEPGMTEILSRLLEIIFIQAVCRTSQHQTDIKQGFIAALRDQKIAKALNAIHNQPQDSWTINSLAQQAGMSRARFAERFAELVGIPPIGYLTQWRLIKSRALLSTTSLDLEEIANRCGYRSASAFSRRFKEEFTIGPGAYRSNKK